MKIGVILFAYKRPKYLKKALKTHKRVEGLDYFAFVDYSEMQREIINLIKKTGIYDVIYQRIYNYGLNDSIRKGINETFNKGYDAVIVLEDDLLLADDAIEWLKYRLELFHKTTKALTFSLGCDQGSTMNEQFRCHAWGIWKDRWEKIDWTVISKEKNRDSWDVIVNAYMQQAGLYCFCSDKQRVKHIGWSGVHFNQLDRFSIRRLLRMFR